MNNDNKIVCSHEECDKFANRKIRGFYFCEEHAEPLFELFKMLENENYMSSILEEEEE